MAAAESFTDGAGDAEAEDGTFDFSF